MKKVGVADPVHDRLQARQRQQSAAKDRWVTLSEVIEDLLDQVEAANHAREARQDR